MSRETELKKILAIALMLFLTACVANMAPVTGMGVINGKNVEITIIDTKGTSERAPGVQLIVNGEPLGFLEQEGEFIYLKNTTLESKGRQEYKPLKTKYGVFDLQLNTASSMVLLSQVGNLTYRLTLNGEVVAIVQQSFSF